MHVNLPEGIIQESACFWIAMAHMHNDPDWYCSYVHDAMRGALQADRSAGKKNAGGMPNNTIPRALQICDMTMLEFFPANPQYNAEYKYAKTKENDPHLYKIEQDTLCLLSFTVQKPTKTRPGSRHSICLPFGAARDLLPHIPWHFIAVFTDDLIKV